MRVVIDKTMSKVEKVLLAASQAADTRMLHIKKLGNLANEIDLLHREFNKEKIKGNGASLLGGKL